MSLRHAVTVLLVPLAAACGGRDDAADAGAASDTMPAGGMVMPSVEAGGMMDQMRQHLQLMAGLRGDSLQVLLPDHRQRVADMLAQMNREMSDMSMTGDTAWNALADSLRDDLARVSDMTAPKLQAFMNEHAARVTRMMQMHRRMMGGMRM
jgi:UDP-N-acetylglucosamine transferase subunit ALG13